MSLFKKIMTLYPSLTREDFVVRIRLRNDSDGKGDYIDVWNHPTLPKPTQAQLDAVQ